MDHKREKVNLTVLRRPKTLRGLAPQVELHAAYCHEYLKTHVPYCHSVPANIYIYKKTIELWNVIQ